MTRSLSVIVWVFALGSAAAAAPPPADLVLLHGKIHTEDARRSVVQAMALRGNGIVAVGTDEAIGAFIGPSTQQVDLAGRVVLPGIIDAHTHPAESAQDFGKCNLEDVMLTIADLERRLAACLQAHPLAHDQWFDAVNVNQSGLTLELKDLDAILPDRPMLLESADGHTVWANSAALALAHITSASKDPSGGLIERDAAGRPTGTLRDDATGLALNARPASPRSRMPMSMMTSCRCTSVSTTRTD